MKITTGIDFDTRRIKQDGTYPVRLRIYFQGERKYYNLGIDVTQEEYKKIMAANPKGELRDTRMKLDAYLAKADRIINGLEVFSIDEFEKKFNESHKKKDDSLITAFEAYTATLKAEGRQSTSQSYECAKVSLNKFKAKLKFTDITPDFLNKYEKWMVQNGNSLTTVGIYLRNLRAILNLAVNDGRFAKEKYPFGRGKYVIPKGSNTKKALLKEQVSQIINYPTILKSPEDRAKDFWLFSYYCNGMNTKDILRLKGKNLTKDKIWFVRAKTEHTLKHRSITIEVMLNDRIRRIIEKWGNYNAQENEFVFPFLKHGMSAKEERDKVLIVTKSINKYMKKMGAELGFELPLTTYVARHTYSTVLMRGNAPLKLISANLGHASITTTESYLSDFDDETKKKYADMICME